MNLPKNINKVFDKIEKEAKPVSVFLYGSRARTDYKRQSDYEVGILFKKDEKWSRRELAQLHNIGGLNLYPFVYEDFVNYDLDTPFPKSIYLRELIKGAKTVKGEKVVEKMKSPEIRLTDLLEDISFSVARSLAAVLSSRQEDWVTTTQHFTKSALFGGRVLVILKTKKFPLTYDEIAKQTIKIVLEPEFKNVIKHALAVRKGKKIDSVLLYTNISFLNQSVRREVKMQLKKGDKIVLPGVKI